MLLLGTVKSSLLKSNGRSNVAPSNVFAGRGVNAGSASIATLLCSKELKEVMEFIESTEEKERSLEKD